MERLELLDMHFGRNILAKRPERAILRGRYVLLEPLDTEKHHRNLYENLLSAPNRTDSSNESLLGSLV